jgi:hypothetical protein
VKRATPTGLRAHRRRRSSALCAAPCRVSPPGQAPLPLTAPSQVRPPAAGLHSAQGSLPWGTRIDAALQQPDQTQIAASVELRRTKSVPDTPETSSCLERPGILPGARRVLSHGKISGDPCRFCADLRSDSTWSRAPRGALPRCMPGTRSVIRFIRAGIRRLSIPSVVLRRPATIGPRAEQIPQACALEHACGMTPITAR